MERMENDPIKLFVEIVKLVNLIIISTTIKHNNNPENIPVMKNLLGLINTFSEYLLLLLLATNTDVNIIDIQIIIIFIIIIIINSPIKLLIELHTLKSEQNNPMITELTKKILILYQFLRHLQKHFQLHE